MKPVGDAIRVLLIEDDPEDAEIFADMIGDWRLHRFEITVADGIEAAAAALRRDRFDTVVTDLGLGPFQGLETLEAVRSLCLDLPLVVLTGLDEASVGLRAIEIGAQAYLEKGETNGRQAAQTILHAIQRSETLAALDAARRKAEAAEQARSRFFATLSHELRQPLNGMLGYLQLLERSPADAFEEHGRYHAALRQSAEHMLGLVNDILDYAKAEAGEMQLNRLPVDLAAVLQEAVTTLSPLAAQHGVQVDLSVAPERATRMVIGDQRRLCQVAINLLSNAIRFSPEGARVRMATGEAEGFRWFSVEDRGPGMDAAGIAVALDPFGQVHRKGGTGLGLPFCDHVAKLHGGQLRIDSSPGQGTTATILLPAAVPKAPAAAPTRGTAR